MLMIERAAIVEYEKFLTLGIRDCLFCKSLGKIKRTIGEDFL